MTENSNNPLPDWMYFVGKWGKKADGHSLAYHLLDSAAVADLLWRNGLTQGSREQLANWLKLSKDECGRLLAYWTSLHDLGKATPSFQMKHVPSQKKLKELGFDFPPIPQIDIRHHSLLSQWILLDFKSELGIQPTRSFNQFRYAIGGHHGTFHILDDEIGRQSNLGDARWNQARKELFTALTAVLNPPLIPELRFGQTDRNAFFNLLTGFFVASDWISSQDDPFSYCPPQLTLEAYWNNAQKRAQDGLQKTGWIGWQPDSNSPDFSTLFEFQPHPLQEKAIQQIEQLKSPFLMIIEAPTGCGKTEAALVIADRIIAADKLRGFYIAMPTQATSNQMFDRAIKFLSKRFPNQTDINVQLVHGNSIINENFQNLRLSAIEDLEGSSEGNVHAQDWFLPHKRSLLAPFGVGTVDQTFLSILRARHSFLRLFGLHRKVIIFDEVHAYDIYMMEIFNQLLAWLRAIGSSVIILTATLPEKTRLDLLQTFQPSAIAQSEHVSYPRLSINNGQVISTSALGEFLDRKVHLVRVPRDPQAWLGLLHEKLAQGGCAAIICNTVDRAQDVYRQIRDTGMVHESDLFLLHARMPYCWRKKREDEILRKFGKMEKPSSNPRRGIVVATQIIEQSLDLDFDLLVTDLAPIDLLIQRIGRLQRHTGSKYEPIRPVMLEEPLCLICQPSDVGKDELPHFEKDEWVYDAAILQRTFFALSPYQTLSLPGDSDALINTVYSEKPIASCSAVQNDNIFENLRKMNTHNDSEIATARNRMVGNVDFSNAFGDKADYLSEDDPAIGIATSAMTRNSDLRSIQLVCFIKKDGQVRLLDADFPHEPSDAPFGKAIEHALKSMVILTKKEVVRYFDVQPQVESWKKIPALRKAYPVVFENGEFPLYENIRLQLDEQTGVSIV